MNVDGRSKARVTFSCMAGVAVFAGTLMVGVMMHAGQPSLRLVSVMADGQHVPVLTNGSVELPAQSGAASFIFGPNPSAGRAPLRFRCQLDGYEQGWHERTVVMRMVVRFVDANQRDITERAFPVTGASPGWKGSYEESPWVQRKEVIAVPAGAVRFWVVISSAGPPEAVGTLAVRKLRVFTSRADTMGFRMIAPVKRDAGRAVVEGTEVAPPGWGRGGIRPTDARLLRYGPGEDIALGIVDEYPQGHADWNTSKVEGPELTPGEEMTLEWEEVYSIGAADFGRADYTNVPVGLYRFRMEELTVMGMPTGSDISQLVTVPASAWKTPSFWVASGLALFAAGAGSWRLSAWRRMKGQVLALERLRILEQERFRIAQNIHDDLGARVTEIALVSSSAQLKPNLSDEARAEFGRVSRLTSDLVRALYETVWAVSPENDHLDSLASYICQMANQMCAQAQLRCRLEIPDLPEVPVSSPIRHNITMAVKEAIHNVMKHAHASEIQIGIRQHGNMVRIQVADNGCGFDPARHARGNGLDNMERRLRSVQGSCSVEGRPGAGTKVSLVFPLPVP